MSKKYEYDLPFTAHTWEIGVYYQNLLESYEKLDLDAVERFGTRLVKEMKEDISNRSEEEV